VSIYIFIIIYSKTGDFMDVIVINSSPRKQMNTSQLVNAAIEELESSLKLVIGEVTSFFAFGTNQLTNYKDIEYTYINSEERLKRYKEEFPKELIRVKEFAKQLI
jgi:multimeric flavodoxin WrbA